MKNTEGSIWKRNAPGPVAEFLGWVLFLTLSVQGLLLLLEPWSILYAENGRLTIGYGIYAILGMLASTPSPFIALWITLRRAEKITLREYLRRIVRVPSPKRAVLVTGFFCAAALAFALLCGTPNGAHWVMMPLGWIVMIPFVGIAEEPGWRGFLQPELEKRFPFPIATSLTAAIWYVWHLPIWAMPTSNHYGDSLIGFGITIFVWSFAAAAIYKATQSTLACAVYHAFINAIGAVYDWNALFDAYPKTTGMICYFVAIFAVSTGLWVLSDRKAARRRRAECP